MEVDNRGLFRKVCEPFQLTKYGSNQRQIFRLFVLIVYLFSFETEY